ncbi:MAG: SGNH/GDSL hydrolase family protein [Anaerolineae bacterium]|nr:SGNH/GDSL hydrolase family protein [Anaerolineae bacterium]
MTRKTRIAFGILIALLLGVILAAGAAGNYLFRYAETYYRDMNTVRLDPLGLDAFSDSPTPIPGQQMVVFFGDSRAADWPAPVMEGFTFINRGIHGQTSAQVAGRFDAHIRPLQPDIVILQVCVNDLKVIPLFPERQSDIQAACIAHIRQIVTQAQAIEAKIILTTVFPVGEASFERRLFFWSDAVAASVGDVNTALYDLTGDGVYLLDAYAILADESGLLRPAYAADTLHLNPAGYAALDTALRDLLVSLAD